MTGSALYYVVTYIPEGRSEPVEYRERVITGDPDTDVDELLDRYEMVAGDEIIHVRWSTGETIYAAPGIDR